MDTPVKKRRRQLGGLLLTLGALLGLWIFGNSTWAQFEATLFDADLNGASQLDMTCPRFLAADETGYAQITLHNPTDKDHSRFLRTHITDGLVTLMREDARLEPVPAGESVTIAYPLTADEAVYGGKMIFIRSFVVGRAPLPSASATCGVYVVHPPFGLTGREFMWGGIIISIFLMAVGLWVWRHNLPAATRHWRNLSYGMLILAASIIAGLALSVAGQWFFAGIALLITILIAVALLTPLFSG